ncbi:MAG: hypothetical protein LBT86_06515 [Deltaproteobacteria bacterium]|jgi:hypothetical protein|nr:hypothetical protein [Deltaproteobacteria bacterium]
MPYIYSGVCLAAMFGSIFYERYLMKKEEAELCEKMRDLAESVKSDLGYTPLAIPQVAQATAASQVH